MNVLKRWLGIEKEWDDEMDAIVERQRETRQAVMDATRSAEQLQQAVEEEERNIEKRRSDRRMQAQIDLRRPERRKPA